MAGSKLSIKAPVGQGVSKGSYLDKHKTARYWYIINLKLTI